MHSTWSVLGNMLLVPSIALGDSVRSLVCLCVQFITPAHEWLICPESKDGSTVIFVNQLCTSLLYIFIATESDKVTVNVILPVRLNIPVANGQTASLM